MAYYIGIQHFDLWQSHLYFSWTGGQVVEMFYFHVMSYNFQL